MHCLFILREHFVFGVSPLQFVIVNLLPKKAIQLEPALQCFSSYVHGVAFSLFESVLKYIIQRERQLFDV
jgi:hypothetical protein